MNNEKAETISKTVHEVNRAYCAGLGDHSQPAWEDAPVWQQRSIIAGIMALLNNPAQTPEEGHSNWMSFKERDGWKYGPVKCPEKKEHPCMVPYENLPSSQRAKDSIFRSVVLGMAGLF